jgi:RNA polymerase sigma-70 factor (ECF subfamily)
MEAIALAPPFPRSEPWDDPQPWIRLFLELAAGRSESLAALYDLASTRLHGLALWRTGSRDDAAEVVQEVFVHVAQERERLAGVRDPRWWLLAVTHRIAVDVTRRRARRRTEPIEGHPYLEAPAHDPTRGLDARRVSALLARLSPKQREVIYLHDFAGLSYADIGRSLGIPTFTAASRYRLGVARLRSLFRRES